MKKIGLIGGMSWESSRVYYELINKVITQRLGGFHSCHSIMESLDFAEIEALQKKNNWNELCKIIVRTAKNLEMGGAELIILCTNTMHLCSEEIRNNTTIPFLHIATATGRAIRKAGLEKILLLGTKYTMELDFYREILQKDFNIEVMIPGDHERDIVHNVIFDELVHGEFTDSSREKYINIINSAIAEGAQGVILGCTEIPLLIKQKDVSAPVFDTTKIHAEAAVELSLSL